MTNIKEAKRLALEDRISFLVEPIKDADKEKIAKNIQYQEGVKVYSSTAATIKSNLPAYRFKLGNSLRRDVLVSEPTNFEDNGRLRPFALLYVPGNDREAAKFMGDDLEYHIMPIYQSSSHGMWRILPGVTVPQGKPVWYNKGGGEIRITLPVAIQRGLSSIWNPETKPTDEIDQADFEMLAPITRHIRGYWVETSEGVEIPVKDIPAQKLHVPKRLSPNFSQTLGPFTHKSARYGDMNLFIVPNNRHEMLWVFGKLNDGRTYIANLEHCSPLNSAGVPNEYISAPSEFITPPEDYHPKAATDDTVPLYIQNGYASRIPVVRDFKRAIRKN